MLIIISILFIMFCTYMLYRNNKVYDYKMYHIIHDTLDEYLEIPDYDYLMWHWNYKLEIPNE